MRVNSAIVATALLAGFVQADAQSVLKDASSAATEASSSAASIASDASSAVESATDSLKPTFTVCIINCEVSQDDVANNHISQRP